MLQQRRFRVVTPDGTVRELNYDGSAQKIQL